MVTRDRMRHQSPLIDSCLPSCGTPLVTTRGDRRALSAQVLSALMLGDQPSISCTRSDSQHAVVALCIDRNVGRGQELVKQMSASQGPQNRQTAFAREIANIVIQKQKLMCSA